MWFTLLTAVALLEAAQAMPGEAPRPVTPRDMLSADLAQSLLRKLEAIERRQRSGRPGKAETVLVTEGELNSYLNLGLGEKTPQGVSDIEVRLERDRLAARAMVDLDQVKGKVRSSGPLNPFSLLSGSVPLEVRGRFTNEDGFGTIDVEEVRLGPVNLPLSVLEQMVASATRSAENPEGFDLRSPFRLPYAVKRIRLQPGRALLDL